MFYYPLPSEINVDFILYAVKVNEYQISVGVSVYIQYIDQGGEFLFMMGDHFNIFVNDCRQ